MSNLTHLARFLNWARSLPVGIHLGREIRRRYADFDFLTFCIKQPILYIYARILIDGEKEPLEGFVVSLTLDPKNNIFSVRISNQPLPEPMMRDIALDKLRDFDQLSTDQFIERARSVLSPQSRAISKDDLPPLNRRFECSQVLTTLRHQL